ncbi:MAG: ribosomal protein S18-alanine N-acetyltransferase [Thermoproteota archaeon]
MVGDFSIREARRNDLGEIMIIEEESFPQYPYSRIIFENFLMEYPRYFLVAEHAGRLIGYVCSRATVMLGEVSSIAVAPKWRRKGVGGRLMGELEYRFKTDRVGIIYLQVSVKNSAAILFYKKLGYVTAKVVEKYYLDGSDALVMVKRLKNF